MHRLVWSRLRRRPGRAAALVAGILVAATSFTLLTASVRTARLITVGTVSRNARSAYDILVRPPGARTPLERRFKLVQDNFLSGIYGGITMAQYHRIARIPGVQVAAPVANLGYIVVESFVPLDVRPYLTAAPFQAFRLRLRYVVGGGQHVFPDASLYVYVTKDSIIKDKAWEASSGRALWTCFYFNSDPDGLPASPQSTVGPTGPRDVRSAFDSRLRTALNCVSTSTRASYDGYPPGDTIAANVEMPVELAAIDPAAMSRLVGLNKAVVNGRMLKENEATVPDPNGPNSGINNSGIPVLLTSRPYPNEALDVQVQRLLPASPADLPARLNSPAAFRYLTHLPGRQVGSVSIPLAKVYGRDGAAPLAPQYGAWLPGPVRYRERPDGTLAVANLGAQPAGVWSARVTTVGFDLAAPVDNMAPQVRRILAIPPGPDDSNTYLPLVVGRFDPDQLLGFSVLSRVPLETFRAPVAVGADPASRTALHGEPLLPDRNLGGYLQQPPAMLTTLGAIPYFINSRPILHNEQQLTAPLSVIMIRVAGVRGVDALSRARVNAVVGAIRQMFPKLTLDVTLGSSPQPQVIALPAGLVAPAAVRVREGWAKLGVALAITQAVDRKSAVLFGLILVVCALFLGHASVASVRSRRAEIGTLRSLGWSRAEVFGSVLAEPAAAGLVAGIVGAGVAWLCTWLLGLDSPAWYPLLVVPVAVALAVCSGALAAWRAARIGPLEAISRPVPRTRRAGAVRGMAGLAVRDLSRVPGRTALGALALSLGVAALTILLAVTVAYRGAVSVTLLGEAVVTQARGVDYLSAVLALALGVVGAVDVLMISLRERAPELAMLRASGWSQRDLSRLTLLEGLSIGLAGGLAGAAAGLGAVAGLGAGVPAVAMITALAAAAGGALLVTLAAAIPAIRLATTTPVAVLSSE